MLWYMHLLTVHSSSFFLFFFSSSDPIIEEQFVLVRVEVFCPMNFKLHIRLANICLTVGSELCI